VRLRERERGGVRLRERGGVESRRGICTAETYRGSQLVLTYSITHSLARSLAHSRNQSISDSCTGGGAQEVWRRWEVRRRCGGAQEQEHYVTKLGRGKGGRVSGGCAYVGV